MHVPKCITKRKWNTTLNVPWYVRHLPQDSDLLYDSNVKIYVTTAALRLCSFVNTYLSSGYAAAITIQKYNAPKKVIPMTLTARVEKSFCSGSPAGRSRLWGALPQHPHMHLMPHHPYWIVDLHLDLNMLRFFLKSAQRGFFWRRSHNKESKIT